MSKLLPTGLPGVLACVAALLAGSTVPVRAAEEDPKPQTYAILIGIDKYADPQIKSRGKAEVDASSLYDLAANPKYLGVKPANLHLLLGSVTESKKDADGRAVEPATHENVLKRLRQVIGKARRDDLVLFAFIGEGAPLGDHACYFTSDSTFKDRAKNALGSVEIEQELEKLKSQRFCAFLDVNFKGFDIGKEQAPDANLGKFYQEFFNTKKDPLEGEDSVRQRGRVVFLATDGLSQSLDLDKHGLFTTALLAGLQGAADKDGYEADGVVTVDELIKYLETEIPTLVHKNAKTEEQKELIHGVLGSRSSHFDLTHNPTVTGAVDERLKKLSKLAQDKKINEEVSDEGEKLLSHMPKLKAYQDLRKSYQKLVDGTITADEFFAQRKEVFDGMKLGKTDAESFARKVLRTTAILKEDYIKPVNTGELIAWAVRGIYRQVNEELPQEIRDQLAKAKDLKDSELQKLLTDVRERLGKREDLAEHKDVNFALHHMLSHLDPYTSYIDPETLTRFKSDTSGKFTGIGVQIRKDMAKDMLRVVTPLKGSPAYKAGVKAGDVILQIIRTVDSDGDALDKEEIIPTKGMRIDEAVKKILGKPGTKVKLLLERDGEEKPLLKELTRSEIEMESVLGYNRKDDDSWSFYVDPDSKIGYVRITSFTRNTSADLTKAIERLTKAGLKGLVLDLRFNPGGLLNSACEVCDLFIDDGLIVTIRPRVGKEHSEFGQHEGSQLDFPLVVLVNGLSASGSEIVAACLQDHDRAIVMGERSYGKGSVQNIIDMENRSSALKLTTATYWRPSNRNIHRFPDAKDTDEWGVMPSKGFELKLGIKEREELTEHQHDQEIIPNRDDKGQPKKTKAEKPEKAEFKDRQLELALKYLRDQIKTASNVPTKKAG